MTADNGRSSQVSILHPPLSRPARCPRVIALMPLCEDSQGQSSEILILILLTFAFLLCSLRIMVRLRLFPFFRSQNPFAQPFALSARYAADRGDAPKGEDDFVPDLNVRLICRDCKVDPPNLAEEFESGDLVCADCGLVVGENIIDTRSEWRTFANEDGDDPSRVGAASNPLLDGINEQLESRIGYRDGGTGLRGICRGR